MLGVNCVRLFPAPQQYTYCAATTRWFISTVDIACSALVAQRSLHTSGSCRAKNLLKRFVNKSKKKLWYETAPQTWSPNQGQDTYVKPPRKRDQEDDSRFRILNSVLFKAITELLTSPQLTCDLYDYSPELSKVTLARDFSNCRVFWKTSTDPKKDELIQQALDQNSARIRYLIMSQQTMGGVPTLVFLRDKQYAAIVEVEKLLQQADFGPESTADSDRHTGELPLQASEVVMASEPAVLFGVDHKALNQQIADYRQRCKETGLESEAPPAALIQAQLTALQELKKKQIINKKRKKSRPVDDDITPREFLLAQQRWGSDADTEVESFKQEETELQELMSENKLS